MADRTEELRTRREEARRRRIRRRRASLAGAVIAGLGAAAALAISITGGDSDEVTSEPADPAATTAGGESDPGANERPRLTNAQLAGQRIVAGWEGPSPPTGLRTMIRRGEIAGLILFDDNVRGVERTRRTIAQLQRIRRPAGLRQPLLVAVDQEGGLVKRLTGPPAASAAEMGARGSAYARRQGEATAELLRAHGINADLAPVLDVARPGSAIEREQRAFGERPAEVIAAGVGGFADGLREGGVAATAKHFPGIGAAAINTDDAEQRIGVRAATLRRTDERPFAAFADAGGELVMLGLATYPALADRPAAFSGAIVRGELRGRLGFEGVTITDSLDAAAAQAFGGRTRVVTEAARAGSDLMLYGGWETAQTSANVLRRKLVRGKLERAEFEASVNRVLDLRSGLAG